MAIYEAEVKVYKDDAVKDGLDGVYDKITNEADTLTGTFGQVLKDFLDAIDDDIEQTAEDLTTAISNNSDKITGQTGGNVIIDRDANGKPYQILIMDTNNKTTATRVVRLNNAGIGFSNSGYNGPYQNAWSIDGTLTTNSLFTVNLTAGHIGGWSIGQRALTNDTSASEYISLSIDNGMVFRNGNDIILLSTDGIAFSTDGGTTYHTAWQIDGTFTADYIQAGTISDSQGNNYWDLDTGEFSLSSTATIGGDTIADYISDQIEQQIDGIIETWYQATDPANDWTTAEARAEHEGDLWYNTTDNTTQRYSGTAWQDMDVPDEVFDAIDGKTTIFYGSPSGTYTNVQTGDYLVNSLDGRTYKWDGTEWDKVTDYATSLSDLRDTLQAQIDARIETWARATDPSTQWGSNSERLKHDGDLWLYTGVSEITVRSVLIYPQGVYKYKADGNKWMSYASTSDNLFDLADGKSTIYYGSPTGSYTGVETGDYLVDSSTGNTYRWTGSAWSKQTDYTTALQALEDSLEAQIDAKIETWAQSSNPASAWTTTASRTAHDGDLWLYTGTSDTTVGSVTIHPQGTYKYNGSNDTWSAYSSTSSNLFDLADGKKHIFYGTTSGTYAGKQTGDYLVDSTDGCTYRWTGSAWSKVTDYKTAISTYDSTLTSEAVFNKLTNNGTTQGIYRSNGLIYINASYVKAGLLADVGNNTVWNLTANTIDGYAPGSMTIKKGSINIGNGKFSVNTSGAVTAKEIQIGDYTNADAYGLDITHGTNTVYLHYDGLEIYNSNGSGGQYVDISYDSAEFYEKLYASPSAAYLGGTSDNDICFKSDGTHLYLFPDATTGSAATNLVLRSSDNILRRTSGSSRKIKDNIKELTQDDIAAEKLYDLPVVQFVYNEKSKLSEDDQRYKQTLPGFILEDMDEVYPVAIDKGGSEDPLDWRWNHLYLIPPMLKLIQDQKKQLDKQADEISVLRHEMEELKAMVKDIKEGKDE